LGPAVGKPLPGEEACHRDHQPRTSGGNGLEARFRSGWHSAVEPAFPVVTHDADVQGTGMPGDAAGKRRWMGGAAHAVSSCGVHRVFPPPAYPWGRLRGRPHTLSRACNGHPARRARAVWGWPARRVARGPDRCVRCRTPLIPKRWLERLMKDEHDP
jgi:hypothetical protein